MLPSSSSLPLIRAASLSVPYFTGFVMLPSGDQRRLAGRTGLSVPYFTGFVMLLKSLKSNGKYRYVLSVPYFTGFVMLLLRAYRGFLVSWPFSPLFYGIRDVTLGMLIDCFQ